MNNKKKMTDYMAVQLLLSEREKEVRENLREFVNKDVLPEIDGYAQREEFPVHLIKKMANLHCYGSLLPRKYGGQEWGPVAYGLLMYELERGDSALRSFASVQGSLVMYPIFTYGSEDQKQKWLPAMARGEAIGCFGLTEPQHGSNPAGMETSAVKNGTRSWRLNGTKMWITNGSVADVSIIWAKTEEGFSGFLVEKETPGLTTTKMHNKWSLRASVTSTLQLQDVIVDESNRLPKATSLKAPLSCLTQARYGIAWGVLGAAEHCYQTSLEYAKKREQFGKPIASYQLQQEKLVKMVTELTKGQLLALHLARLKEVGSLTPAQVSLAKMNNVEAALQIARSSRTIMGATGISGACPIMRHANNLESVYTYEGTHDMHTLIVGKEITGVGAFS